MTQLALVPRWNTKGKREAAPRPAKMRTAKALKAKVARPMARTKVAAKVVVQGTEAVPRAPPRAESQPQVRGCGTRQLQVHLNVRGS